MPSRTLMLAGLLGLSSLIAHADTLLFTFSPTSGGSADSFSFFLSSSPTPATFASGFFTSVNAMTTVDGVTDNSLITFSTLSFLTSGGLEISQSTTGTLVIFDGAQLYSGTEANPIFMPETVTLTEPTGSQGTLVISTTPEPSSLVLLGTGLLGGAFLSRKWWSNA